MLIKNLVGNAIKFSYAGGRVDVVAREEDSEFILYADDELVIDSERLEVSKGGERVQLTGTEQRLLFYLTENAGRVLTNEQILEAVWGAEYVNEVDYVKLYIWRLRQKIEEDPQQPRYILTERGVGYRFAKFVNS
jgi:two-component system KDP operon response regulator KdpE